MKKTIFSMELLCVILLAFSVSCKKSSDSKPPVLNFTASADASNSLMVTFTNTSTNASSFTWSFGDSTAVSTVKSPTHTYLEEGIYVVDLKSGSMDKKDTITILRNPNNLIKGGDMNAASKGFWNIIAVGSPGETNYQFGDTTDSPAGGIGSCLKVWSANGPELNVLFYQHIKVDTTRTYTFSTLVKSAGVTNAWLEIYFGTDAPVSGTDYTSGGIQKSVNTWDGCGSTAFDGDIMTVGCFGTLTSSSVKFSTDSVYVGIKTGTWDGTLGDGIFIDNVSLTPQ